MRILLDTNQVLFIAQEPSRLSEAAREILRRPETELFLSSVSLWEIDLKHRARTPDGRSRLPLKAPLASMVSYFLRKGVRLLSLEPRHVTAGLTPPPGHDDPFDWMLLQQAQAEGLRLLTSDRALAAHPLALKA